MRLLADAMLGRLATYLRMCGYDTVYAVDASLDSDDAILGRLQADNRTLLTRDRALASRAAESILVESTGIDEQLAEIAAAGLQIELPATPQRCSRCNGTLTGVADSESTPEYAPSTEAFDIWRCDRCEQYFWNGSHWDDVTARIEMVRSAGTNRNAE